MPNEVREKFRRMYGYRFSRQLNTFMYSLILRQMVANEPIEWQGWKVQYMKSISSRLHVYSITSPDRQTFLPVYDRLRKKIVDFAKPN